MYVHEKDVSVSENFPKNESYIFLVVNVAAKVRYPPVSIFPNETISGAQF